MSRFLAILELLVLVTLSACSRPASEEIFIPVSGRDDFGRFAFAVDMSDSTSLYSVSLLTSFACRDRRFSSFRSMPLCIVWESPDGKLYEENVEIGRDEVREASYDKIIIYSPYRSHLKPVEYGIWNMYVKTPEDSLTKYKLYGMGIRVRREETEER